MEGKGTYMSRKLPADIQRLIEQFERNYEAYTNSKYNETQVRREFLDPFFEALGWDVTNKNGIAEQYKEVIHEDAIKIQGSTKAPDYCFRVGSERKFFVEAKKPSVNIKTDSSPAYQVRRYAWSAKLPLSILTDFDEFAVYDCRFKPKPTDKASVGRIMYFKFSEIEKYWDEFANIFSREAVWQGSFDKYADDASKKKGTSEVDSEFLKQLEGWRAVLAKNIALRNKGLSQSELNYAVQRTIDRLLFIRISEDRGVEKKVSLKDLISEKEIYKELCKLFQDADDRYNSGLFHFKKENDRPTPPDELSLKLTLDTKVLKSIIEGLYYPQCPYEFSVIPVELLGQVYEQFLGKEISLSKNGKVTVVEKPLVKKAGGVFYTPAYIVEKIVKDTIGNFLRGKTPRQASELKILDPACGSGSFLIGVYDYLLSWHLDWYTNNQSKAKDKIIKNADGNFVLTTNEKKRILLNNVFGVDIDAQAVETTKLSLYLKVLEGESNESVQRQLALFNERALPDIGDNIKCGNSLVKYDVDLSGLEMDEKYKINPFQFDKEFPHVFDRKKSGFDFIVGNPPYLRVQGLNEFHGNEIAYYSNKYKSAVKRYDMYLLFIERSFSLLNKSGELGFICPHKFTIADFGSGVRDFLVENTAISKMISFDYNLIFEKASTYTCLLYLTKKKKKHFSFIETPELKTSGIKRFLRDLKDSDLHSIKYSSLDSGPWKLSSDNESAILSKISENKEHDRVGDVFKEIMVGVQTGIDDIHIVKFIKENKKKKTFTFFSEEMNDQVEIESALVKPLLKGDDIKRYEGLKAENYVVYPYNLIKGKTKILEEDELKKNYPLGFAYLSKFKKKLKDKRIKQKTNANYWYSCHRSKDMKIFESERIIMPYANLGCNLTLANKGDYHNTKAYSLVKNEDVKEDYRYLLAFLNSDLMWWYQTKTGNVIRGGYYTLTKNFIENFRVPRIDFKNKSSVELHDKIVGLVDQLLEIKSELSKSKAEQDQRFMLRQIVSKEDELNCLIFTSFGLTDDEIKEVKKKSIDFYEAA